MHPLSALCTAVLVRCTLGYYECTTRATTEISTCEPLANVTTVHAIQNACYAYQAKRGFEPPQLFAANVTRTCLSALRQEHCTERIEAMRCGEYCPACANSTNVTYPVATEFRCSTYISAIINDCPRTFAACYTDAHQSFYRELATAAACTPPLFVGRRNALYDPPGLFAGTAPSVHALSSLMLLILATVLLY